jgi:hypothetical protein
MQMHACHERAVRANWAGLAGTEQGRAEWSGAGQDRAARDGCQRARSLSLTRLAGQSIRTARPYARFAPMRAPPLGRAHLWRRLLGFL